MERCVLSRSPLVLGLHHRLAEQLAQYAHHPCSAQALPPSSSPPSSLSTPPSSYSSPPHHCHAPPRLTGLTNLHLGVVSSKTLEAVARHKGLKKLVITGTKLTELPRELLAQVIANKREVDLCASELTDHQVEAIVEAVRPSSPLTSLTLKSVNLSTVKPASLQRMLTPLQELNICNCQITSTQVNG